MFPLFAGLQAQLFYVTDGQINEYAMKFVVPVPAHVPELHFTWQNLIGNPVRKLNWLFHETEKIQTEAMYSF